MANAKIGRNTNTNSTANVLAGIVLNATTSTTVLAANPNRIAFHINNDDATAGCWIKLQAASVDNDKKGIFLGKKAEPDGRWDMSPDNIYTGEVSAIAVSGTPSVYITEY